MVKKKYKNIQRSQTDARNRKADERTTVVIATKRQLKLACSIASLLSSMILSNCKTRLTCKETPVCLCSIEARDNNKKEPRRDYKVIDGKGRSRSTSAHCE